MFSVTHFALTALVSGSQPHAQMSSSNTGGIAIGISVAALIVSMALPLFLDSRQPPRVSARLSRLVELRPGGRDDHFYQVSAINRGRAEVIINHVSLSYVKNWKAGEVFLMLSDSDFVRGPGLSHRLTPYSDVSFGVAQERVHRALYGDMNCRIRCSLYLSNGYKVISRNSLFPAKEMSQRRSRRRWLKRMQLRIFAKERCY